MNNFDALLEEITLVSDEKEQMQIAKAFETSEYIENELINRKTSHSLNKSLKELDALSRRHIKQTTKIKRENLFEKKAVSMLGFRGKLKKCLMAKSITPQQAMTLESRFNNLTSKLGVTG